MAGTRTGARKSLIAALTVVSIAGAVAWWRPWAPRVTALDPRWRAITRVVAGDGIAAFRDGDVAGARFAEPFGLAVGTDGTIYVADAGESNRIRRISPDGLVSTIAGGRRGFADGAGPAAQFNTPSAVALDAAGILYVADTANNAVRRIAPDGQVTTYAGDGLAGYRDGPSAQARFNGPVGLAVDRSGRVIVADTYNDRIRAITPDGFVSTIAGSGVPGFLDGGALDAQLDTPSGVAVDPSGRIYIADTGNGSVRIIGLDGVVTTPVYGMAEGLLRPAGIVVEPNGNVYVTDDRGRVVELYADGDSRIVAGSRPGFLDETGEQARFRNPAGIALAGEGRLVVADAGNALVRVVEAPARAGFRLPAAPRIVPAFDEEMFAMQPLLWPVTPMEGPHEIAGTMGEARGSEGAERFHAGIDVRKEQGTPVLAVREGTVSSPLATGEFGSLNEWLRIGPVAYVHIRAGRNAQNEVFDPERFLPTYDDNGTLVRMRVKRGSLFRSGEQIASVNAFNHVHVNVGRSGEELNPLRFRLVQYEDTVPPAIARGGVRLFDEFGQALTRRVRGRVVVSGRLRIVVDAWDQADGNRPERRLGLYDLGYQILTRQGSPAPGFEAIRHTIRFDRLTTDPEAARLVYLHGSGIPFYGRRRTRFLYVVTNTFQDGRASEGLWDTATLPPGDYTVRAWVADYRGNVAMANRDVPVTIQGANEP